MSDKKNILVLMRENKTLLIIIAVALFLIELEIFVLAAMKSGRKSWLQVLDQSGNIIHETDGNKLSDFNKYYFEKTFGPFEHYNVRLVTKEYPFPFRAWFVAAVGIPVGATLLFGFVVKAYMALFYEEKHTDSSGSDKADDETRLEKVVSKVTQLNIFTIGFLVFLAVLAYWVVPNLIVYTANVGIETITKYKWIFLSVCIMLFSVVLWVIYLRYLLAKKEIDKMAEIKKYRLQLEMDQNRKIVPELEYNQMEIQDKTHVAWSNGKKENNGGF